MMFFKTPQTKPTITNSIFFHCILFTLTDTPLIFYPVYLYMRMKNHKRIKKDFKFLEITLIEYDLKSF